MNGNGNKKLVNYNQTVDSQYYKSCIIYIYQAKNVNLK